MTIHQEKRRNKPTGNVYVGWLCNCCSQGYWTERIPGRCEVCRGVEFRMVKPDRSET